MKKQKSGSKLTTILVLCLLICFFCLAITGTNSWFTSGEGLKVHITVHLSNLNILVYQVIDDTEYQINSFEDTGTTGTNVRDYVDLTDTQDASGNYIFEIVPDVEYSLTLLVKDEDAGKTDKESMYMRYKVEFITKYYDGSSVNEITLVPTLTGYSTNASSSGFVKDGDYYYLRDTSGNNVKFNSETLNLFTGFSIPYSEFYDNGNINVLSGDTIRIVLTIQCSDSDTTWG